MMTHIHRQGDLTNAVEVQNSALPSKMLKRPAGKASPECVHKRRAVNKETKCNVVRDELCQSVTPEDVIQSQIESHNPQCPVDSLQSRDYWDSEIHDEDAERLVNVYNFAFDPVMFRKELAKMIILHEYPPSVVDHIGFRDFLRNLNPLFGMVSRKAVENDIMKIFKIERCIAYSNFSEDASGRVAITTKMWTSSDGNQRFLAITGHIIDEKWKLQSFIMSFANVPCTNESISKAILDCLSYFNVDKKLSTITVDNYTSDDKLIDILVDKFSVNNLILGRKLFHLPCFAHTLSLMVQDGFDVVRHIIEKIQDSIVFWRSSPERETTIEKAARELGVSSTSKLVLDNGLNWSSTYLMLQESLVFKDVFFHLRQQEAQYDSSPTEKEWDLVREVCNVLQILHEEMQNLADHPAACMYLINLCDIKLNLSTWLDCEVPEIKEMASKMLAKFDKYWFAARDMLAVASVFHPKYKFRLIERFFPLIYGKKAESEVERIRKIFYDLFDIYSSCLAVNKRKPSDEELRLRLSTFQYMLKMSDIEEEKERPKHYEVDNYLKYGHLRNDLSILSWWGAMKCDYAVLTKMAKDILAIPIFSVDEENAFDVGDRILGANQSRLRPTMIEALMCNQRWIKRRKNSDSKVSSSATNLHSMGTIFDDANADQGIIIKDATAESSDDPFESTK